MNKEIESEYPIQPNLLTADDICVNKVNEELTEEGKRHFFDAVQQEMRPFPPNSIPPDRPKLTIHPSFSDRTPPKTI